MSIFDTILDIFSDETSKIPLDSLNQELLKDEEIEEILLELSLFED